MTEFSLFPIIITGLSISVIHSMMPTHWLPFILAAKTQKWTHNKTLSILSIAGLGHIIMTTLLGAAIFSLGIGAYRSLEKYFLLVSSGSIMMFGLYQIYKYKSGKRHSHCDNTHEHHHSEDYKLRSKDGWAVLSLLSLLTFSPCESFLPVYLSAVGFGWQGFVILSLTLAVGTLTTMLAFSWISLNTISKYKLDWLEDHELLITGLCLIALAVLLIVIEGSHLFMK